MTSERWLLITEAKGLQKYVFSSDSLKEMVGATEIIDLMASHWVGAVIDQLGIQDAELITSVAGAARVMFTNKADCDLFRSCWPLVVYSLAPGLDVHTSALPFDSTTQTYLGISEQLRTMQAQARQRQIIAKPPLTPLSKVNPRSGKAAVKKMDYELKRSSDLIDEEADAKIAFRDSERGTRKNTEVPAIFSAYGFESQAQIPNDFLDLSNDEFANGYIAVIHADGNGLGQVFMNLTKGLADKQVKNSMVIETYKELSSVIDNAAKQAAKQALASCDLMSAGNAKTAFIPIVTAGDDITVVIRADKALLFTQVLLTHFTKNTKAAFDELKKQFPIVNDVIPELLTMGAGITYFKPTFPFYMAYQLCESLADRAKTVSKALAANRNNTAGHSNQTAGHSNQTAAPACSVMFHKVTASTTSISVDDLMQAELSGDNGVEMSFGPYKHNVHMPVGTLDLASELADLSTLTDVVADCRLDESRTQLRSCISHLRDDYHLAKAQYQRWVERGQMSDFRTNLDYLYPGNGLKDFPLVASSSVGLCARTSGGSTQIRSALNDIETIRGMS